MVNATNRGMGAGMHPEAGATHDYAFANPSHDFPQEWDYARGIGHLLKDDGPPPPVPEPPNPRKEVLKHTKRSGYSIAGAYLFMGGMGLVTSAIGGHFGYLSPTILVMMVTLGPVLACAFKDYMHWMDTGEWQITEPTDEPSI